MTLSKIGKIAQAVVKAWRCRRDAKLRAQRAVVLLDLSEYSLLAIGTDGVGRRNDGRRSQHHTSCQHNKRHSSFLAHVRPLRRLLLTRFRRRRILREGTIKVFGSEP